jgi:hypothetical protein
MDNISNITQTDREKIKNCNDVDNTNNDKLEKEKLHSILNINKIKKSLLNLKYL